MNEKIVRPDFLQPKTSDDIRALVQQFRNRIPTPTDYTEKLFLDIAVEQGLLISEAERIVLNRKKERKGDKRVTIPDFLVRENLDDEGIFVEVTENNPRDAHKNRQRKVMVEAGLASRYVQLIAAELEKIKENRTSLLTYIREKIRDTSS